MLNPGTRSVGGKVILAVAVAGDIINKVSKESSGRPSECVKRNVKRKGLRGDKEDHLQLVGRSSVGNVRKGRQSSAIPNDMSRGLSANAASPTRLV